ncbi:hypothetical protein GWL_11200 [Herbaspirillum sp. GW103]|nr:hypothetical protein GWL_11200 [Herbaspirillum sp. GW103]
MQWLKKWRLIILSVFPKNLAGSHMQYLNLLFEKKMMVGIFHTSLRSIW